MDAPRPSSYSGPNEGAAEHPPGGGDVPEPLRSHPRPLAYAAARAPGYHHLGDFYDPGGTLHTKQDLHPRVPRGCTVRTIWDRLQRHQGTLRPLPDTPTPCGQQAPKG